MYIIKENKKRFRHMCYRVTETTLATGTDVLGLFAIGHDSEVIKRSLPELASKKHH